MSKAEEKALKAYPKSDFNGVESRRKGQRKCFIQGYEQAEKDLSDKAKYSSGWDGFYYGKGYEQAEKDLALTWEDIKTIVDLWFSTATELIKEIGDGKLDNEGFCTEVLRRFNEWRDKK